MQEKVSVVHLVWLPYGIQLFKDFIQSYQSYAAGCDHDLIILFNGVKDEAETAPYHEYARQVKINYQYYYYPKGQDLEAYKWIAGQLDSEYIFFVNGYSRFLADDWLKKLLDAYTGTPDAGVIGATGSWQSRYTYVFESRSWRWVSRLTPKENIRNYKLLLKAAFLWRFYFKPFPNPHIRTNSFFIRRSLFADLIYKPPKNKLAAYRIESGRNSITLQIEKKGLKVLMIDRYGKTHPANQWYAAKVFWCGNQENLLIADNQTQSYTNSSNEEKTALAYSAWHLPP